MRSIGRCLGSMTGCGKAELRKDHFDSCCCSEWRVAVIISFTLERSMFQSVKGVSSVDEACRL